MKTTITFEIDSEEFVSWTDKYLAQLWHIAQANPAPFDDLDAGRLADAVGHEIIRRFLKQTEPELYHHGERQHYWSKVHLADKPGGAA